MPPFVSFCTLVVLYHKCDKKRHDFCRVLQHFLQKIVAKFFIYTFASTAKKLLALLLQKAYSLAALVERPDTRNLEGMKYNTITGMPMTIEPAAKQTKRLY